MTSQILALEHYGSDASLVQLRRDVQSHRGLVVTGCGKGALEALFVA
jgi:hypothetical protein